jgi:hypothetical protein
LPVRAGTHGVDRIADGDDLSGRHADHEGVMMGTLGHMSPEQILGGDIDQRTDILQWA